MSFADIINQEQKKLESQGGGDNKKVAYPTTKHKRLFFEKSQKDLFIQVLPSADLYSAFAVPVRKIFLQAKSSQGKDINSNFTLDAEPTNGSLLEQKIEEWSSKGMIPNGFGGQQSPRRFFLVNAVKIVQVQGTQQFTQERDEQGNLVVRVFEMPQSAYANLIRKLGDPLYNTSGTELSFMDINKPALIKVSKPAKGQMEYPVEVYTNVLLPALGQGWETQLEDLNAQAVPTERLENGYEWVQAFVDMKEGRKPNSNKKEEEASQQQQYSQNPFANLQQPTPSPSQPTQAFGQTANPMVGQPTPQDLNIGTEFDLNNIDDALSNLQPNPNPAPQPQAPTPEANQFNIPSAPQPTQQPQAPTHNVGFNGNGLMDIDAMLDKELNGN